MSESIRIFDADQIGRSTIMWDTSMDIGNAYDSLYRFGIMADQLSPETDNRSVKGIILYPHPGGSVIACGKEQIDRYTSWDAVLELAKNVAGQDVDLRGFGLGFNRCNASYTDDRLGKRPREEGVYYQERPVIRVRSQFNLASILPGIIKETDPTNDLSGLDKIKPAKGLVHEPNTRELIISSDPYLKVCWHIDSSVPFSDVYRMLRQFGDPIDKAIKDAGIEKPEMLPDDDGNLTIKKALVRRVIVYDVDGRLFMEEENDDDFDRYDSWEALEADVKAAAGNIIFGGFRVGFISSDVIYETREMMRNVHEIESTVSELSVNSHFDIRDRLKEFIKQTNPDCDVSGLDSADASHLRKIGK